MPSSFCCADFADGVQALKETAQGLEDGVLKYARAEHGNALEALKLAERDSRLGWEPSMEYAAGPEQIRWKLRRMEKLYGW